MTLASPLSLGRLTLKNRICIPPMVLYRKAGDDGMVSDAHVDHYRRLAEGGPGLIIQEATCVAPEGRFSREQLGIWSDGHIPGLRRITEAVHSAGGTPIFVQLHHGGIQSVTGDRLCPSAYVLEQQYPIPGREMSLSEIETVRAQFTEGARRAYLAGFDGVELHGCHTYLLCGFLNARVNTRGDVYGSPTRLIREILEGIRGCTPPGFAVGIRMGAFEPALADGIAHALDLERMGLDFLDVSYGFSGTMDLSAPGDMSLSPAARGAGAIAGAVSVPVFAADRIRTPRDAQKALDSGECRGRV